MSERLRSREAALEQLSREDAETSEKVDALLALAEELAHERPERAAALADEAHALASRLGYTRGRAYGRGLEGYARYMLSEFETALPRLQEALTLFDELGDQDGRALALNALASVHMSMGNYDQALASGLEALQLLRRSGHRTETAWNLHGVGSGYLELGDPERALDHLRESLQIFEEIDHCVGRARALNGIGTVFQTLGQYDEARTQHRRSLELFREAGDRLGEARALSDLGVICQALGEFGAALEYHRRSLQLREEVGNRQAQSTSLINIGLALLSQGDLRDALDVLHRALAIAQEIKSKPRIYQAHEALARAYEQQDDDARALVHHKAFHAVKEDVFSETTNTRLHNLQVSYQVEKAEREAEIARLRTVELRQKNEQLERLLAELKETQAQLVQQEKLASLGQLTAGIAHEIKNPLNFVNNFSQLSVELADELLAHLEALSNGPDPAVLEEVTAVLADLRHSAGKIADHGQRADRIVRNMMLHARGTPGEPVATDLNALVEEYVNLAYHGMRATSPGFNVTLERDYADDAGDVDLVPQAVGQVLLNLLGNAFYAVRERAEAAGDGFVPTVSIATRRRGDVVEIRVGDNGVGMDDDVRERVFEPFFTTKPTGQGTGLGLSLSHDIVTHGHGGRLTVESTPQRGTTFTVVLPVTAGDVAGDEAASPG